MRVLILQHIKIEDPGFIKDLMIKDGAELTTVELDEGEKIPTDLSKFDAMFCMGGPMDTWMEKEHPWLVDEKKAIIFESAPCPTLKHFSEVWGAVLVPSKDELLVPHSSSTPQT